MKKENHQAALYKYTDLLVVDYRYCEYDKSQDIGFLDQHHMKY